MAHSAIVDKKQYSADNDNTDKSSTQLESLMDKLRARKQHQSSWIMLHTSLSSQFKIDFLKSCPTNVRYAGAFLKHIRKEKKLANLECLQKQVVLLQNTIKVTSLMYLIERLQVISSQLGLKFTPNDPSFTDILISSLMFAVRLLLTPEGGVRDVQIAHSSEARASVSCLEMLESVKAGKFEDLKRHLEGLIALYDVDGDKKVKQMMYRAVLSLESDLNMLNRQSCVVNVASYVHKTPLGLLSPRAGGLPMKMTYFIGPYDLLNHKTHKSTPMTIEAILENNIGYSATVGIERSSPHRLHTVPSIKSHENKSLTSNANGTSAMLPAIFVLNLQFPLALSTGLLNKLKQISGVESVDSGPVRSLAALLVEQMISTTVRDSDAWEKYSLVSLLGHKFHRYFLLASDDAQPSQCLQACLVTKIQFTLPGCVPGIVGLLRQQALFNTVLSSCLRPSCSIADSPKVDAEIICFDVTPISHQHISIMFEHPYRQSLCIVELDMSDISNVRCRMTSASSTETVCSDDYASKIFQRSLSLPITLRAVQHRAAIEIAKRPNRTPTPVSAGAAHPVTLSQAMMLSRRPSSGSHVDPATPRSLTLVVQPGGPRAVVTTNFTPTTQTSRTLGNPMLASLLDPEFPARGTSSPVIDSSGDRPRAKRPISNENSSVVPIKRRTSSDEMNVSFPSPSVPSIRPMISTTRSISVPASRSFVGLSNRPSVKVDSSLPYSPVSLASRPFSAVPMTQASQIPVKLEPQRQLDRSPATEVHVKQEPRSFSVMHQRSGSHSELINLLSTDDFESQRNGEVVGNNAGGQYDGSCDRNVSGFRAPSRTGNVGGLDGAGVNDNASGVLKSGKAEFVENSMNWETSPSLTSEDIIPRSTGLKSNNMGHGANVSSGVVVKSEVITGSDVVAMSSAVTDIKPPITVKLKRRLVKPSAQRRGTPQSDSAIDRAAWKERVKQSVKAHKARSNTFQSSLSEAADFEVDGLTSGVRGVSPVSPGMSQSPRIPSGGPMLVDQPPRVGAGKRPRVMNKVGRLPAEKKQRNDEGRKLSRKIYEFDDEGDVFANSTAPVEKISTIKITKSDGRLQIQQPARSNASVSRPLQQLHKTSISGVGGNSHGLTGQKLNRASSLPVRPPVRPKSSTLPRSEPKALASPIIRAKLSQGAVSGSDVIGAAQNTLTASKAVCSTSKSVPFSGGVSGSSSAKAKVIASGSVKKSSLNAVIDKLTKSATSGTEPTGKELYDQIRLEIIREGNKPSTPTRDMSVKVSSSGATKRPDTPKDAASSRPPPIPVRKPVVTTAAAPISAVICDPPKSVVRFTAPPASPPSVTAARVTMDAVSVVVPRIPRDQLTLALDRSLPGPATSSAFTGIMSRSPMIPIRPLDAAALGVSDIRVALGPRPPRPQSHNALLPSPTIEAPRYRPPEMSVLRVPEVVSAMPEPVPVRSGVERLGVSDQGAGSRPGAERLSAVDSLPQTAVERPVVTDQGSRPSVERFPSDDSADRLSTRHFMDAMTHGTAAGSDTVPVTATGATMQVDRRVSPSPSPTPIAPMQTSSSTDFIEEGLETSKWATKTVASSSVETSVGELAKAVPTSGHTRVRTISEYSSEGGAKRMAIPTATKDSTGRSDVVDEFKTTSDDANEHSLSSESCSSPALMRVESTHERANKSSSLVKTTLQSPVSSISSPDAAGLTIDCYPGSPVRPTASASIASPLTQSPADPVRSPPVRASSPPSSSLIVIDNDDMRSSSPSHSGDGVVSRDLLSSPGAGSGDDCLATNGDIDDDLMNEALML